MTKPKQFRLLLIALILASAGLSSLAQPAQPSRSEVLAAMKHATTFMVIRVGYRGGYVWAVSEDFSRRYGEVPARPTQIWVQDGTPLVGMTPSDAYDVTGDRFYLESARRR